MKKDKKISVLGLIILTTLLIAPNKSSAQRSERNWNNHPNHHNNNDEYIDGHRRGIHDREFHRRSERIHYNDIDYRYYNGEFYEPIGNSYQRCEAPLGYERVRKRGRQHRRFRHRNIRTGRGYHYVRTRYGYRLVERPIIGPGEIYFRW